MVFLAMLFVNINLVTTIAQSTARLTRNTLVVFICDGSAQWILIKSSSLCPAEQCNKFFCSTDAFIKIVRDWTNTGGKMFIAGGLTHKSHTFKHFNIWLRKWNCCCFCLFFYYWLDAPHAPPHDSNHVQLVVSAFACKHKYSRIWN